MCDLIANSFYEPGSIDLCDAVRDADARIELEIQNGTRDQMSEDARLALASELVHGDQS